MTRTLIASAAVAAVALVVGGASALNPGPARIRITASQIEVRVTPNGVARTYALYNLPAYPGRIGTGVATCVNVSRGWLDCTHLLRLSHGTIIARSLVPNAAAFRLLGVVGGTGYYSNAGGEMTVQPLGTGQLITVSPEGL